MRLRSNHELNHPGTLTGSLPDQRCATIFPWRTRWVLSELTSHHRNGPLPCRVCSISASAPRMYASKASTVEGFNCTGLTVCGCEVRPHALEGGLRATRKLSPPGSRPTNLQAPDDPRVSSVYLTAPTAHSWR